METTTTTTAVPPLELTRAPRKTPSLDLRDIPQAPGPEKGVLALMAMDPATYVGAVRDHRHDGGLLLPPRAQAALAPFPGPL